MRPDHSAAWVQLDIGRFRTLIWEIDRLTSLYRLTKECQEEGGDMDGADAILVNEIGRRITALRSMIPEG